MDRTGPEAVKTLCPYTAADVPALLIYSQGWWPPALMLPMSLSTEDLPLPSHIQTVGLHGAPLSEAWGERIPVLHLQNQPSILHFSCSKKVLPFFQGAVAVVCKLRRELLLGVQPKRGSSGLGVSSGARLGPEASGHGLGPDAIMGTSHPRAPGLQHLCLVSCFLTDQRLHL